MHESCYLIFKTFIKNYTNNKKTYSILEIGSKNVNKNNKKTYSEILKTCGILYNYTGLDIEDGDNVDIVTNEEYKYPIDSNTYDIIICSSVLEHVPFFWETFLEIVRITKKNGLMFFNTPANGRIHKYPLDCWRFYPDAYKSLELYSKGQTDLLENFIYEEEQLNILLSDKKDQYKGNYWHDNIGIFKKNKLSK